MRIGALRVNQQPCNMSEKSQTKEKKWFPVVIPRAHFMFPLFVSVYVLVLYIHFLALVLWYRQ